MQVKHKLATFVRWLPRKKESVMRPSAAARDSNGFRFAKIVVASFVTDFDVVKHPIGCILTTFSKTTSNKLSNRILYFYISPFFGRDPVESYYSYFSR
jgi:hypothetical protein